MQVLIKDSTGGDASPAASSHDAEILEDSDEMEVDTPILWEVSAWVGANVYVWYHDLFLFLDVIFFRAVGCRSCVCSRKARPIVAAKSGPRA